MLSIQGEACPTMVKICDLPVEVIVAFLATATILPAELASMDILMAAGALYRQPCKLLPFFTGLIHPEMALTA